MYFIISIYTHTVRIYIIIINTQDIIKVSGPHSHTQSKRQKTLFLFFWKLFKLIKMNLLVFIVVELIRKKNRRKKEKEERIKKERNSIRN